MPTEIEKISVSTSGQTQFVDAKTEYFNGEKWKKINKYTEGEPVLAWYPDGRAAMEQPKEYIACKADQPFYNYCSNILDMCLAASHCIAYMPAMKNASQTLQMAKCGNVYENWKRNTSGFGGSLPLTFKLPETVTIDEAMLRIAVMLNAEGNHCKNTVTIDGTEHRYDPKNGYKRDVYALKPPTEEKQRRARAYLEQADIRYCETPVWKNANRNGWVKTEFRFRFPFNPERFPKKWIYLAPNLKKVLLDELLYWEGRIKTDTIPARRQDGTVWQVQSCKYYAKSKDDADLIQMIAHSAGKSTRLRTVKKGRKCAYILSFRSNTVTTLSKERNDPNGLHTGTFKKARVRRQYCLVTNSGYIVLRRNGKIFITGRPQQA